MAPVIINRRFSIFLRFSPRPRGIPSDYFPPALAIHCRRYGRSVSWRTRTTMPFGAASCFASAFKIQTYFRKRGDTWHFIVRGARRRRPHTFRILALRQTEGNNQG